MPWYRAGSVAVTNGSAIVTGAGTDFVGNTQAGEAFLGPDGREYEISGVQSATQLTIIPAYQGASAGGQAYGIQPTASFARDLAILAAQLLNTFGAVRDGVGQGLFPDGSLAAPAMRFAADQDTGLRRVANNVLALTTGGQDILTAGTYVGIGTGSPLHKLHVNNSNNDPTFMLAGNNNNGLGVGVRADGFPAILSFSGSGMAFGGGLGGVAVEYGRFDNAGNMLIGTPFGTKHTVRKDGAEGSSVFEVYNGFTVFNSTGLGWNQAGATVWLTKNITTNRTINAAGTINASGADYAEYMFKSAGCGIIAKGDVCGVDQDGKLTKTWADAVSFVIKSTDPSLVGGDTWGAHLPPKPDEPTPEPIAPVFPTSPFNGADEASLTAWQVAYPALVAAYNAEQAVYQAEHAAWQQATEAYAVALAEWEQDLEAARQCVDRIAFCGQVPCNVTGDFDVGDYIIAAANGAGIKAIAVKPDAITLPQYMRRIGKVWAIRDGRAWIDVQHG
ncbi:hypothetical protein [Sphingomonas olei]|uniref:Peptidase S74 domain-containing protein n=1 Tax=Sphingomonas olei TaxID=1886787 RepID=A0ABY2QI95_9SPHN|nr:hypothetical protein [Sphingomonas olei]THG40447.1 hypothetical protein E5988_06345 [Sphingomonas olei]